MMQKKEDQACNFLESPMKEASKLRPFHVRIAKRIPNMLFTLKARLKYNFYRKAFSEVIDLSGIDFLDLQPGDWVEVRTMEEIATTLDEKGKNRGLYFMPEMEQFCGKRFKVFKKAEKIKLESTGDLRTLKNPSYFLDGVHCNGEFQGGCDRACFHFWRDVWLKKVANHQA